MSAATRVRFVSYPAKDGYRWRLLAGNHKIIAESGEAYTTRHDCHEAIDRVRNLAPAAELVVQR